MSVFVLLYLLLRQYLYFCTCRRLSIQGVEVHELSQKYALPLFVARELRTHVLAAAASASSSASSTCASSFSSSASDTRTCATKSQAIGGRKANWRELVLQDIPITHSGAIYVRGREDEGRPAGELI